MRLVLLFLLLISFSALAEDKEEYCHEGTNLEMRECSLKKLVKSDKKLKQQLTFEIYEEWLVIRQRMCEEAYLQYKEGTLYSKMIIKCSAKMNKTLLQKIRGLN